MNSFIEKQELYIKEKIKECGYEVDEVVLNVSSRPEFGDYQYNGVMGMAKKYGKNPREIATEIVENIKKDNKYKDINIAGPGFINITFSPLIIAVPIKALNCLCVNEILINSANLSIAIYPALWRVFSYSFPGFPNPTISFIG